MDVESRIRELQDRIGWLEKRNKRTEDAFLKRVHGWFVENNGEQ